MSGNGKKNGNAGGRGAPCTLGLNQPAGRGKAIDASRLGFLQWFHIGQRELAEQTIEDLSQLGVRHLRTGISWADWYTEGGKEWYDWLLPRLTRNLQVLPCLLYTPPSLGVLPKSSSPPRDPKLYADFLDVIVTRYGHLFEWLELWNEPNNISEWDWTLDRDWMVFCQMIGGAAYWAKQKGKRVLLGGMSPIDPNWLRMMFHRGVMQYVDAVGVHGFPGVFERTWEGWPFHIQKVQAVLDEFRSKARVWITEAGFSTWRHEQRQQMEQFLQAAAAPADRVYWYSLNDLAEEYPTVDGFHSDDREYHFGLRTHSGEPKLLLQVWREHGLAKLPAVAESMRPAAPSVSPQRPQRSTLVTGGAGFIGTNLAQRLLEQGRRVIVYDNLSRPGVEQNLRWLKHRHGDRVQIEIADMRDRFSLRRVVGQVDQVFHLAAQVAVTTSLARPVDDFEINVGGTMNLLEAIRACKTPPSLLFTSTNKVYGALEDVSLASNGKRYEPENPLIRKIGIGETRPLQFHSPYGCSKGAADQYVLDFARSYSIPAVVFRMSCIYGPHQFGTEDQGWVAHFLISAIRNRPVSLYGDGMQVRDILYVEDLVEAMLLAQSGMDRVSGQAFNIGGGPGNTISLLEFLNLIESVHGRGLKTTYDQWRIGDQRYYVSNTGKFESATGWRQRVTVTEGVTRLYQWLLPPGKRRERQRAKEPHTCQTLASA